VLNRRGSGDGDLQRARYYAANALAAFTEEKNMDATNDAIIPNIEPLVSKIEAQMDVIFGSNSSSSSNSASTSNPARDHDAAQKAQQTKLRQILMYAVEFGAELCQQRSCWYLQYPADAKARDTPAATDHTPLVYDESSMEVAINRKPGPFVTLVVSPALVRRGNAYGEQYDQRHVRAKCVVLCHSSISGPRSPVMSRTFSDVVDAVCGRKKRAGANMMGDRKGKGKGKGSLHRTF